MKLKFKKILPFAVLASVIMTSCDSSFGENSDNNYNEVGQNDFLSLERFKFNAINDLKSIEGYYEYSCSASVIKAITIAKANIYKESNILNIKSILKKEAQAIKDAIEFAKNKFSLIKKVRGISLTKNDEKLLQELYDESTLNWAKDHIEQVKNRYINGIKPIISTKEYRAYVSDNDDVINNLVNDTKYECFSTYYRKALLGYLNSSLIECNEEEFNALINHRLFKAEFEKQLNFIKKAHESGKSASDINEDVITARDNLVNELKNNIKYVYRAQIKKETEIKAIQLPEEWKEIDVDGFNFYNMRLNQDKKIALKEVDNSTTVLEVERVRLPEYSYNEFITHMSNLVSRALLSLKSSSIGYNQEEVYTNSEVMEVINNARNVFQAKYDSFKNGRKPQFSDFEEVISEQKVLLDSAIDKVVEPYITSKTNEILGTNLDNINEDDYSLKSLIRAKEEVKNLQQEALSQVALCNKNISKINNIRIDLSTARILLIPKEVEELDNVKKASLDILEAIIASFNKDEMTYFGSLNNFNETVEVARNNILGSTKETIDEISNREYDTVRNLGKYLIKKSKLYEVNSKPSDNFEGDGWEIEANNPESDFGKLVISTSRSSIEKIEASKTINDLSGVADKEFYTESLNDIIPTYLTSLDERLNNISEYEIYKDNPELVIIISDAKNHIKNVGPFYVDNDVQTRVEDVTVDTVTEFIKAKNQHITNLINKLNKIYDYEGYKNNPDIKKIVDDHVQYIKNNKELEIDDKECIRLVGETISKLETREDNAKNLLDYVSIHSNGWTNGHDLNTQFSRKVHSLITSLNNHEMSLSDLNNLNINGEISQWKDEIRNSTLNNLNTKLNEVISYEEYKNNPDIVDMVNKEISTIKEKGELEFNPEQCIRNVTSRISELENQEHLIKENIDNVNFTQSSWINKDGQKSQFSKKLERFAQTINNHEYRLDELKTIDYNSLVNEWKQEIRDASKKNFIDSVSLLDNYEDFKNNSDISKLIEEELKNINNSGETEFNIEQSLEVVKNAIKRNKQLEEELLSQYNDIKENKPEVLNNWIGFGNDKTFVQNELNALIDNISNHKLTYFELQKINLEEQIEGFKATSRANSINSLEEALQTLPEYEDYINNPDIKVIVDKEINNINTTGEVNFNVIGCYNAVKAKLERFAQVKRLLNTMLIEFKNPESEYYIDDDTYDLAFGHLTYQLSNNSATLEELENLEQEIEYTRNSFLTLQKMDY